MPKRIKKKRKITVMNDGVEEDAGFEEYYDYIFPDDDSAVKNMKIFEVARMWKEKQKKLKVQK